MTVPSIEPVNNYIGNGSVTTFDFDFLIEYENELVVLHTNTLGIQTRLQNNIDYTINEIGVLDGSFINFPKAGSSYGVLQSSEILSLTLDLEIEQEKEITNSGKLYLHTIEWCFDYVTRILQIISRKLERCVKVGEGSNINPDNLLNEILTTFAESLLRINEATQESIRKIFDETLKYAKIEYVDSEIEGVQAELQEQIETVNITLDTKVDKVTGMGLSDENFTAEEKEKLSGVEENANNYILPDDVVQDADYTHTDNNFTGDEKTKLSNIEDNANNYTLPDDVVHDSDYVHTDNNFTDEEKGKLAEIEVGANNYTLPSDVVQDSDYVHTDSNFTDNEKVKLAGIEDDANNYILPSDVVQDNKYVHTDNNFTNTEKVKLAGLSNFTLTRATNTDLGGIKADNKLSTDTQPVRIDPATGKLFTAPSSGGSSGGDGSGSNISQEEIDFWNSKNPQLVQGENIIIMDNGDNTQTISATGVSWEQTEYWNSKNPQLVQGENIMIMDNGDGTQTISVVSNDIQQDLQSILSAGNQANVDIILQNGGTAISMELGNGFMDNGYPVLSANPNRWYAPHEIEQWQSVLGILGINEILAEINGEVL